MEDVIIRTGVKYLKSKRFNVELVRGFYKFYESIHYDEIDLSSSYSRIDIHSSIYNELKNTLSTDDDTIEVIVKSFISDSLSISMDELSDTIVYHPFNLSYSGITTYNIHYGNG
jgi:hypothetical protein